MALEEDIEVFIIYVTFLSMSSISIHTAQKAQIKEKVLVLPEITDLNQYAIVLQKSQQLSYKLIYSLGLVKLKTLKTYLKTYLDNSFILCSKLSISTLIFFIQKPVNSIWLSVNY